MNFLNVLKNSFYCRNVPESFKTSGLICGKDYDITGMADNGGLFLKLRADLPAFTSSAYNGDYLVEEFPDGAKDIFQERAEMVTELKIPAGTAVFLQPNYAGNWTDLHAAAALVVKHKFPDHSYWNGRLTDEAVPKTPLLDSSNRVDQLFKYIVDRTTIAPKFGQDVGMGIAFFLDKAKAEQHTKQWFI